MKSNLALIFLLFFSFSTYAQKHTDNFAGKWKSADGHIITVTKIKNGFIGTSGSKKTVVLSNVKFENGKWIGYVSNPIKKEAGPCELFLEPNRIKIIAYKGLLFKTIYWTKVH
ncbi:MAG: hypothetical protein V4667_02860 [Bacteroidota bacterium]